MGKIEYPSFIDVGLIKGKFDQEGNRRYILTIPFSKKPSKMALAILKNPSKATEKESDITVNRIISYIHKNLKEIDMVIIANLFVYCSTNAKELNLIVDDKGKDYVIGNDKSSPFKTDKLINEAIEKSLKIIIAWGNSNGIEKTLYKWRVKQIFKLLEGRELFYVKKITKKGNPLHGQSWGYDYELLKYKK